MNEHLQDLSVHALIMIIGVLASWGLIYLLA